MHVRRALASLLHMDDLSPSLDHLGWVGPDLEEGARRWVALGFRLSRVSPQMGFTGPGGALEPWASANRCAVFETGYLELIGLTDPARHNPWKTYLARGAGPHIAAFRINEADVAYPPLASRVDGFDPPVQRRRMAPLGLQESDGEMEMRFRNIFSQDDAWPEGRFIVIEHQTPEALWQPVLTEHPNGAKALVEAIFTSPTPDETADRLARLLNQTASSAGDGYRLTAEGGGLLTVTTPAAFAERFPGAAAPDRPAVAGAVVKVSDLGRLDGIETRLSTAPDGARYAAGPDAAGGVIAFIA